MKLLRSLIMSCIFVISLDALGQENGFVRIKDHAIVDSEQNTINKDGDSVFRARLTCFPNEIFYYEKVNKGFPYKVSINGCSFRFQDSAVPLPDSSNDGSLKPDVTRWKDRELVHIPLDIKLVNEGVQLILISENNERLHLDFAGDRKDLDLSTAFIGESFCLQVGEDVFFYSLADLEIYIDPTFDTDGDGIVDIEDDCTNEYGLPGDKKGKNGCPETTWPSSMEDYIILVLGLVLILVSVLAGVVYRKKQSKSEETAQYLEREVSFRAEDGLSVDAICAKYNIEKSTFCEWNKKALSENGYTLSDNGKFENTNRGEHDPTEMWLIVEKTNIPETTPVNVKYETYTGGGLTNFANEHGCSLDEIFAWNLGIIGCSFSQFNRKTDNQKKSVKTGLKNKKLIVPFTKDQPSPVTNGSSIESDRSPAAMNGGELKRLKSEILDALKPISKLSAIERGITKILLANTESESKGNYQSSDLTFLKGYTSDCLDYLELCSEAIDKSREVRTDTDQQLVTLVGELLLAFHERVEKVRLQEWQEALIDIRRTGKTTSSLIGGHIEQLNTDDEIRAKIKEVFIKEVVATYCNQVLVLVHALSKIDHFGIESNSLARLKSGFHKLQLKLLKGAKSTGIEEFVFVELETTFNKVDNKVNRVAQEPSNAYKSLQIDQNGDDRQILEIISFGVKINMNEKTKTLVILA